MRGAIHTQKREGESNGRDRRERDEERELERKGDLPENGGERNG